MNLIKYDIDISDKSDCRLYKVDSGQMDFSMDKYEDNPHITNINLLLDCLEFLGCERDENDFLVIRKNECMVFWDKQ